MRRLCVLVLLSVIAVLAAISAMGCAPPPEVPCRIAVVDADTGVALSAFAYTILLADGQGDATRSSLVSSPIELALAANAYKVQVAAPGYWPATDHFDAVDYRVPVERTIALEPRRINVQVVDAVTGERLSGVAVTLGEDASVSDVGGQASFRWSEAAEIALRHPRYKSTVLPLEPLAEGDVLVIGELEPRRVNGTIVDADSGAPLVGVKVVCGAEQAMTDQDGQFSLAHVAQGETLSFSAPGFYAVEGLAQGADMRVDLEPITQDVVVQDATTDAPLAGVAVTSTRDKAATDDLGAASLRIWEEDALDLSLTGYAPLTTTITADASPERLRLTMTPSRLALHLRHVETGRPITLATVLLYQGDQVLVRVPDAQGDVVVEDITGIERALVKAPSYAEVSLPITRAGDVDVALAPFDVRAVYIPFGALTLPDRIEGILDMIDASPELNGIVVDVKSDRARLAWPSEHPLAVEMDAHQTDIMDLSELLDECERRGIYAVARLVIFKDDLLAQARPEWAVMRDTGEVYLDNEDLRWVDPFRQEVRDYNINLALEIAAMGWDEVQFDYLRFPSDGGTKGLVYQQESVFETRTAAMAEFVAQAHDALEPTPAFFSADIFGLTVWVDSARDMGIGQRVDDIAPYVDYLSPMLYPTTFTEGNLGFDDPGAVPYEVIYHSVLKTLSRTHTPVRPWLQAYSIGRYEYGLWELLAQKKGAVDADSHGWIYWNAAGKYMPEVFQENAYDLVEDLPEPPEKD